MDQDVSKALNGNLIFAKSTVQSDVAKDCAQILWPFEYVVILPGVMEPFPVVHTVAEADGLVFHVLHVVAVHCARADMLILISWLEVF